MDDGGSWAGVAVIGLAAAAGLICVVGTMGWNAGGLRADAESVAAPESRLSDELGEHPLSLDPFNYTNCASMIGCFDWNERRWEQWVEEQLAAGKDPFGPHETASNCVGFCFNGIVESVDEEDRRLARVVMIGKKGKRTPALVERTSVSSSSVIPAGEGQPVRFACFDRVFEKDELRFESCSQMVATE